MKLSYMRNSNELKSFISKLALYLLPFILLFAIFWCTYYRYYSNTVINGDLTKLAMRMDDQSYYHSFDTLPCNYLFARYEYSDDKQKDTATIWVFGDSFTQNGGGQNLCQLYRAQSS